jgi:alpha-amylase
LNPTNSTSKPAAHSKFVPYFYFLAKIPSPLTFPQATIAPYFVPIAYAIILLHCSSVHPCVFYADLYGSSGSSPHLSTPPTSGGHILPRLIVLRDLYAYGPQLSYFDTPCCIGFTRQGHKSKSGGAGLAVIMSNAWGVSEKRMNVGKQHAGEVWTDVLKWCWGEVAIDEEGWGDFGVGPRSVSVWVDKRAVGRQKVDGLVLLVSIFSFMPALAPLPKLKSMIIWLTGRTLS